MENLNTNDQPLTLEELQAIEELTEQEIIETLNQFAKDVGLAYGNDTPLV